MFKLVPVFIFSFFLSLNYGALLYVNSAFLGQFFSGTVVSLIFLLGALLNIAFFFFAPRLLNILGKERALLLFLSVTLLGTLGLAIGTSSIAVAISFIIYESFIFTSYLSLDVFLEEVSKDRWTGEIRGIYLTFINAGIAAGPLLVSLLSPGDSLKPLYYAAALVLALPMLLAFAWSMRKRSAHAHKHIPLFLPFRSWWRQRNIRAVSLSRLVLETFYGLMVIYTPLYLHNVLRFDWSELGIMFTVMLLPFMLFIWPAGEMADRFWGEKEMMGTGFFIMGSTLLIMPFLGKSFFAWMAILFLSRVGASLIEVTTESYFFKKIDAEETGILSIFRLTRPTGLIFGATIGALTISALSFPSIFLILAIVVFLGLRESMYIEDTL